MFCDDFKILFPKYSGMEYIEDNAEVTEVSLNARVKKVVWKNSGCQKFDPEIVKNFSSFFNLSDSDNFFKKDCDGILLFDDEQGSKNIVLCELKSTFDTTDLYTAYKQIVSSFVKICALMYFLPNFNKTDLKAKGFIFTKPKNTQFLRDLSKKKMLSEPETREEVFVRNICAEEPPYVVTPKNCPFIKSLGIGSAVLFDELELYHIEVERKDGICEMDASRYFN